jgi:cytochrome c556
MDITVNGQTVSVDDSFKDLPLDKQNATVDEIAKSLPSVKTSPTEPSKEKTDLTKIFAPEMKQMQEYPEKLMTRDPSQAGKVPLSEYGANIKKQAAIGGGIGAGLGMAGLAPGMLFGGASGAVVGALSGLAESAAKDLGYGTEAQTLASMAGGGVAPVKNTVGYLAKYKLLNSVNDATTGLVQSLIPKYGTLQKIAKFLPEQTPKVDVSKAREVLGVEGETAGVKVATDPSSQMYQFRQQLEKEHGQGATVTGLYDTAKTSYDTVLSKSTKQTLSNEFKELSKQFPNISREGSMAKIQKLFTDEKGNILDGANVIEKLKSSSPEFQALTQKEQEVARKGFNDLLEKQGLGRSEEVARKAAEKEFVAKAKDTLPELFKQSNYRTINQQMSNFAKDDLGKKTFKNELAYYLKGRPVEEAKTMWANIGENVNKTIIKDPIEFKRITDIINNAKSPRDISRASQAILKASYLATRTERKK